MSLNPCIDSLIETLRYDDVVLLVYSLSLSVYSTLIVNPYVLIGRESQPQWTIENLALNIGHTDSVSSGESGDEVPGLELPLSPGLENLTPEDVPGVVGVSQTNPYGCHFCDKAFPRLSFLKIHEQVSFVLAR